MNNPLESFTREVNFDDLVVGKQYKLLFENGAERMGTHVPERFPGHKSFEIITASGHRQFINEARAGNTRFFETPFAARRHLLHAYTRRNAPKSRKSRVNRRRTSRRRRV
jgi:hypothetical protein